MLHLESCCNSRCVENSRNRISLTLFLETPIFRKSWKANGSIKRHLCKLTQETQESWFKVLPVPLMRAQTAPPPPAKWDYLNDRPLLCTDIVIDPRALELWLSFQFFNLLINWRLSMVGFSASRKGLSSALWIPSPTANIRDASSWSNDT